MHHSAGGIREGGTRPSPVEGSVCGMWGGGAGAHRCGGTDGCFWDRC